MKNKVIIEEILDNSTYYYDKYEVIDLWEALDFAKSEINSMKDTINCYASALADRDNELYKMRKK